MHRLKKATLEVALGLLIPLSVMSADDDGTFTITIQGPDVEESAPARQPVRRTSRFRAISRRRPRANIRRLWSSSSARIRSRPSADASATAVARTLAPAAPSTGPSPSMQ